MILVEPEHTGHRMLYCAALIGHATQRGVDVALATSSETSESEEFRLHIGAASADVELIDIGSMDRLAGLLYPFRVLRLVARLQAADANAEIVVLEGDKFVLPAALSVRRLDLRRTRILVMRAPQVALRWRGLAFAPLKLVAMAVLSLRGAAVRVLAPATAMEADYRFGPWKASPDPVQVKPDETQLPAEMAALRSDPDRHWIGVFGHIARRKNLDMIIKAAIRCGPERTGLVIGGKVMPDELRRCHGVLDQFERQGGVVIMMNRLLTNTELDSCISAVDVVVLAHSSEGPSGIFGKAAALGTFVVSAGARSLRKETATLGMGIWTTLDAESLADGLRTSTRSSATSVRMADSAEFARALLGLE